MTASPTIAFQSAPRQQYPMNHNSGFFIIFSAPDFKLVVDDRETAPEKLIVTVASSNHSILPPRDLYLDGVSVGRFKKDTPEIWRSSIRPAKDQFGDSTLTFTMTDGDGLTDSVQITVSVTDGNRMPFASYDANSNAIRLPENATAGDYVSPGFLVSQSPGEGEEQAQTVAHEFLIFKKSGGSKFKVATAEVAPTFDPATGDFQFSLPEDNVPMVVFTWPVDSGPGDRSLCTFDYQEGSLVGAFTIAGTQVRRQNVNEVGPCWAMALGMSMPFQMAISSSMDLKGAGSSARYHALMRWVPDAVLWVRDPQHSVWH